MAKRGEVRFKGLEEIILGLVKRLDDVDKDFGDDASNYYSSDQLIELYIKRFEELKKLLEIYAARYPEDSRGFYLADENDKILYPLQLSFEKIENIMMDSQKRIEDWDKYDDKKLSEETK